MGRKIKEWMNVIGKRNLIAICVLIVLLIVLGVSCSLSDNKKKTDGEETKKEDEIGLQVQENVDDAEDAEGSEFTDFVPDEADKDDPFFSDDGVKPNTNNTQGGNTTSGGKQEGNSGNGNENNMQEEQKPATEGFGAFF